MLHYDQTAASYDAQYSKEQNAKMEAALHNIVLEENDIVLDVGCGTGLLFPHIADKTQLLIAIDISRSLLKQAKKRAKQHPNIALIQADADQTPFKTQTFHALFTVTLLQNMPNPKATLREIERITRPEATIALTTLKKRFTQESITELLKKAKLKITILKTTAKMKDYIITCQKQAVHSDDLSNLKLQKEKERGC
jgi:ubiquinone/menaquinone biosynthesis C-methylase UbiE